MRKLYLVMAWVFFLCLSYPLSATILTFEDLSYRDDISGTAYHDIYWEFGNRGSHSEIGSWMNPDASDPSDNYFKFPYSGNHNLTNSWGCTVIGFQFPSEKFENGAIVEGAYFAVHGFTDNWAHSIIVKGFKDNLLVWTTPSLILTETPKWLEMQDNPVDRVVIYTTPRDGKSYGWFGMDDLEFEPAPPIPEPATLLLFALGTLTFRRRK